jgi:hypothetical protein
MTRLRTPGWPRSLSSESSACSNQLWISARTTWSRSPKQIAEQSIRRSRWTRPHGPRRASSIGGSKSAGNGGAEYAVPTAGSAGSKLLICVPRVVRDHDSWCCESHATSCPRTTGMKSNLYKAHATSGVAFLARHDRRIRDQCLGPRRRQLQGIRTQSQELRSTALVFLMRLVSQLRWPWHMRGSRPHSGERLREDRRRGR